MVLPEEYIKFTIKRNGAVDMAVSPSQVKFIQNIAICITKNNPASSRNPESTSFIRSRSSSTAVQRKFQQAQSKQKVGHNHCGHYRLPRQSQPPFHEEQENEHQ